MERVFQPAVVGPTGHPTRVSQQTGGMPSERHTPGPELPRTTEVRGSGPKETVPTFRATVISGQSNGDVPPTWMKHLGDILVDGDVTVVGTDLLFRPVDLGVAASVCQAIAAQVVDQDAVATNARVLVLDANGRILIETSVTTDALPDCSPGVHIVHGTAVAPN